MYVYICIAGLTAGHQRDSVQLAAPLALVTAPAARPEMPLVPLATQQHGHQIPVCRQAAKETTNKQPQLLTIDKNQLLPDLGERNIFS
jgi:hypothetical protein